MNPILAALAAFVGFGVMATAGLGAATLFIPLFYYTGTPLPEAISTGLLLNVVALGVALPGYVRARTVNLRLGIPILLLAAALAPVGAAVSGAVDHQVLLVLFAALLATAGALMLFYRRPRRRWEMSRPLEVSTGTAVGSGVGFLAGLLGIGGGVFVLPVLHGIGLDARTASGTTALVALVSSISGFAARAALGDLDAAFAAATAAAAGAGALIGSRFASARLSSAALKRMVGIILLLIALRTLWDALG